MNHLRSMRPGRALLYMFLLLALLALPTLVRAAITAEVDRTRLGPGETVELRIRLEGDRSEQPDLTPLEEHFDILSRSQSAQTRIINWKREEFREWMLVLAPKRSGIVVIPPIRAGGESTQPITLRVAKGGTPDTNQSAAVYLETRIEPESAYVQSQVLLIVRVVHRHELEGNLTEPEINGALVEKIGDQRTYSEVNNGVRYRVTERRYAVFPQRSGTLEIPALILTGTLHRQAGRFGFNPFGPAQNGKTIRLRSEPKTLQVQPRPADWPAGQTWLPALDVSMTARWTPEDRQSRTGEPLVLQVTTEARGLAAAQIPAPTIRWPDGLQVYPDKAVLDNQMAPDGITGTRVDRYTVIPSHGGRYTIGEILLPWWNTRTGQPETARIATVQLQIEGPATVPPTPSQQQAASGTKPAVAPPASSPYNRVASWLPWLLCALLATGWVATTGYLLRRQANNRPPANVEKQRPAERQWYTLARACRENRPHAAFSATLAWQRGLPEASSQALQRALTDADEDPALAAAWRALGTSLYGDHPGSTWDGLQFFQAISEARKRILQQEQAAAKTALPGLYPAG